MTLTLISLGVIIHLHNYISYTAWLLYRIFMYIMITDRQCCTLQLQTSLHN